jgi:hypothetical protein
VHKKADSELCSDELLRLYGCNDPNFRPSSSHAGHSCRSDAAARNHPRGLDEPDDRHPECSQSRRDYQAPHGKCAILQRYSGSSTESELAKEDPLRRTSFATSRITTRCSLRARTRPCRYVHIFGLRVLTMLEPRDPDFLRPPELVSRIPNARSRVRPRAPSAGVSRSRTSLVVGSDRKS